MSAAFRKKAQYLASEALRSGSGGFSPAGRCGGQEDAEALEDPDSLSQFEAFILNPSPEILFIR
jgi:hypothetical protein